MTEKELLNRFCEMFYSMRWEHRLTQAELARKARISPETVSKIENKECSPSMKICFKIATAYNMTLSELFKQVETGEILAAKVKRKYGPPY